MYRDLKENWSYNEWPDVDLNGNIINKKQNKKLSESMNKASLKESVLSNDDLVALKGKSIKLLKDVYYCDMEDWFSDEIPDYMVQRGEELYIPAGTVLECKGEGPSGWPVLGPDDLDFATDEIEASVVANECVEEALGDTEICPKCGKVLIDNDPKFCKDGECDNKVPLELAEGKKITQYVHYDKDGLPDAEADTEVELAKKLGVQPNAIRVALARKSPNYAKVVFDEDDEFDDIELESKKSCENCEPLKEADEQEEELDLSSQVKDALDSLIPEDEDFDRHELLDAILAYFTDDDAEYVKLVLLPEEEVAE